MGLGRSGDAGLVGAEEEFGAGIGGCARVGRGAARIAGLRLGFGEGGGGEGGGKAGGEAADEVTARRQWPLRMTVFTSSIT